MNSFFAFMKKEWMEQLRSGRLMVLMLLFVLLGIMSPAIAKLLPWLLEMMADSLAESGVIVNSVVVSAMDSWVQFFKNIPLGLIAFILLESSIFTKEYQSGTLILALAKGIGRYKIVLSKSIVLTVIWTIGYWICYGITYGYSAYFWDNAIVQNLLFSAFIWWLFGTWTISLTVLFSTMAKTNTGVLAGTGMVVLTIYILGLFPKLKTCVPTFLMDGNSLIYGVKEPKEYLFAWILTVGLCGVCFAVGIPVFHKKQL